MARGKSKEVEHDHEDDETVVDLARGLAEIVSEHNLTELVLDTKEVKLTIRRGGATSVVTAAPVVHHAATAPVYQTPAAPAGQPPPAASVDDKSHTITSPFVGTFYRKPNPDSPNYVALNESIDKGAVLCIIEAMKLMNEIESEISGTVIAILVEDGQVVEYGQPLFKIKP